MSVEEKDFENKTVPSFTDYMSTSNQIPTSPFKSEFFKNAEEYANMASPNATRGFSAYKSMMQSSLADEEPSTHDFLSIDPEDLEAKARALEAKLNENIRRAQEVQQSINSCSDQAQDGNPYTQDNSQPRDQQTGGETYPNTQFTSSVANNNANDLSRPDYSSSYPSNSQGQALTERYEPRNEQAGSQTDRPLRSSPNLDKKNQGYSNAENRYSNSQPRDSETGQFGSYDSQNYPSSRSKYTNNFSDLLVSTKVLLDEIKQRPKANGVTYPTQLTDRSEPLKASYHLPQHKPITKASQVISPSKYANKARAIVDEGRRILAEIKGRLNYTQSISIPGHDRAMSQIPFQRELNSSTLSGLTSSFISPRRPFTSSVHENVSPQLSLRPSKVEFSSPSGLYHNSIQRGASPGFASTNTEIYDSQRIDKIIEKINKIRSEGSALRKSRAESSPIKPKEGPHVSDYYLQKGLDLVETILKRNKEQAEREEREKIEKAQKEKEEALQREKEEKLAAAKREAEAKEAEARAKAEAEEAKKKQAASKQSPSKTAAISDLKKVNAPSDEKARKTPTKIETPQKEAAKTTSKTQSAKKKEGVASSGKRTNEIEDIVKGQGKAATIQIGQGEIKEEDRKSANKEQAYFLPLNKEGPKSGSSRKGLEANPEVRETVKEFSAERGSSYDSYPEIPIVTDEPVGRRTEGSEEDEFDRFKRELERRAAERERKAREELERLNLKKYSPERDDYKTVMDSAELDTRIKPLNTIYDKPPARDTITTTKTDSVRGSVRTDLETKKEEIFVDDKPTNEIQLTFDTQPKTVDKTKPKKDSKAAAKQVATFSFNDDLKSQGTFTLDTSEPKKPENTFEVSSNRSNQSKVLEEVKSQTPVNEISMTSTSSKKTDTQKGVPKSTGISLTLESTKPSTGKQPAPKNATVGLSLVDDKGLSPIHDNSITPSSNKSGTISLNIGSEPVSTKANKNTTISLGLSDEPTKKVAKPKADAKKTTQASLNLEGGFSGPKKQEIALDISSKSSIPHKPDTSFGKSDVTQSPVDLSLSLEDPKLKGAKQREFTEADIRKTAEFTSLDKLPTPQSSTTPTRLEENKPAQETKPKLQLVSSVSSKGTSKTTGIQSKGSLTLASTKSAGQSKSTAPTLVSKSSSKTGTQAAPKKK